MDSSIIQTLNKEILTIEKCHRLYYEEGHYAVIKDGKVVALVYEE